MLLEVRGMTVRYGGLTAVDDVSISVEPGAFAGLIGPNGAGKTTFIDAVTGITRAQGQIIFDGERIDGLAPHRRTRRGLVRTFQSLELFEDLTVRDNLLVAAERTHWWTPLRDLVNARAQADAVSAADEALEMLELADVATAQPQDVSLGRRKLITVARALSARPKLLLLDEPAAGLDTNESAALGALLRRIVDRGTTILLVDHDMGLVLGFCDQIHALEFGKLISSGSPREVADDPEVVRAYLGEDGTALVGAAGGAIG